MATRKKQLNTSDVMAMFGVGQMTVYNWRKGSARVTKLPFYTETAGSERHRVYFLGKEVRLWAKANNIPIVNDL